MRYLIFFVALALCLGSYTAVAQSASGGEDHVELGVFADYFDLSRTTPNINFVGIGGRAAFNVHPDIQLEAEMSYDFKRNFSSVFSNGVVDELVTTRLRPLHALFGPKFQTGSGPFRAFATVKVGFVNFTTTNQNATNGFTSALGAVTSGDTRPAIYPGVGVEGFFGPFGLRLDGGDDIYFDHGAQHNLKVTFGPVIRF